MPLHLPYIPQQFLDQIHVRKHHSPAAISVQAKLIHSIAIRYCVAGFLDSADQLDIALVEVGDDLVVVSVLCRGRITSVA